MPSGPPSRWPGRSPYRHSRPRSSAVLCQPREPGPSRGPLCSLTTAAPGDSRHTPPRSRCTASSPPRRTRSPSVTTYDERQAALGGRHRASARDPLSGSTHRSGAPLGNAHPTDALTDAPPPIPPPSCRCFFSYSLIWGPTHAPLEPAGTGEPRSRVPRTYVTPEAGSCGAFSPLFKLSSLRTGQTSARRHSFASRQPPAPPAAPSQRGAAAPGPAPRPLPRGSSPPARSPRLPTWPRRSGRSPSGEALRQESFFLCLPAPLRRSNPSRKPSVPRCPHRAAHPAPPGTPRSGSRPNPTALSPLGCGHAPAGAGLRDTARAGRCRRHLGRSQAGGKR